MLRELHVKNFAIIEEQSVSFGVGFNVISGETGAGKSILLHALEIALGAKASAGLIRTGEDSLEVSALIDLSAVSSGIVEELPDIAKSDELVVSRSVSSSGKGRIYINGSLGSVSLLSEVMGNLVNICAQNQHVRLLDSKYHLELIDGFAGNLSILAQYCDAYKGFRKVETLLRNFEEAQVRKAQRIEELQVLVEALSAVKLSPDLREELENEVRRLANAEKLLMLVQQAKSSLDEEPGLQTILRGVRASFSEILKLDQSLTPLLELYEASRVNLEEFEIGLEDYATSIELNEDLLGQKRDELAQIAALERKYKTNDVGLIDLLEKAKDELAQLKASESEGALRAEREKLFSELNALSSRLSEARKKAAADIERKVERELSELNMKGAKLEISFAKQDFGPDGVDKIEIRISTNKGEAPKALKDIASGGELSRILLVLKKILRDQSGVNVLVFDEVDSGVSGSVARAVGEKLKDLSKHSQVICITHLAQIASLADRHFLVEKQSGKRTKSIIRELNEEERVEEIARMLAGHKITDASRQSAKELIRG